MNESRTTCDEHCDEHHWDDPYAPERDDAFRDSVAELLDAYHRTHDERFPARPCTHDICARLRNEISA